MSDGATDLSSLLGGGPVQSPAFAPMVTGGGDPFISPQPSNQPAMTLKSNDASIYMVYRAFKNLLTYISFFVAAVIISLPVPRHLFLQYIPNTYTSGGVVSYMGAGILGLIAVAISYILSTLFNVMI
jgi:hypothetical protein